MTNFSLGKLKTLEGSALSPLSGDRRMILNLVSITGDWIEDDFANGLVKRWVKVKDQYRGWWRGQAGFKMGEIQNIQVQSDTMIANLICINEKGKVDFEALETALKTVGKLAFQDKLNVHVNDLGGKNSKKLLSLFQKHVVDVGCMGYIYVKVKA